MAAKACDLRKAPFMPTVAPVGMVEKRGWCWVAALHALRAGSGSGLAPGWLRAGSGLAPGRTSARSPPWAGVAGSPEGCSAATIRGAARSPL